MAEIRTLEGELKFLEKTNEFITPVEVWAYNNSVNRNNWQFINLEEHRAQWAGVPLLVAYIQGRKAPGDGHNQTTKRTRDGEEYQSFTDPNAERICGAVSDNPDDIRLEERDGYTWVVCKGYIYSWYNRELVDYLAALAVQGSPMSVSIEALVTESRMEDGVEVEESYIPLGITLLGEHVNPAVVDAHIAMLNAMQDEFQELKVRAASYINRENATNKPKNSETKGMKSHMNLSKQQVKELNEKFEGYTVLCAEQFESGQIGVCLMSENGGTATYSMASLGETVYAEKIMSVNAQVHFCFDGEEDVCVDASDMTECAAEDAKECKDRAEAAEAEAKECKATIEKMVATENARRLSAAKEKATATLAAFNANRDDKVEEKVLSDLTKDIENGKFTACADENGAWTGDAAVEKEVLSLCAAAVMKMDKALAEKKAQMGQPITWGNVRKASAKPGTVGELFASKN